VSAPAPSIIIPSAVSAIAGVWPVGPVTGIVPVGVAPLATSEPPPAGGRAPAATVVVVAPAGAVVVVAPGAVVVVVVSLGGVVVVVVVVVVESVGGGAVYLTVMTQLAGPPPPWPVPSMMKSGRLGPAPAWDVQLVSVIVYAGSATDGVITYEPAGNVNVCGVDWPVPLRTFSLVDWRATANVTALGSPPASPVTTTSTVNGPSAPPLP
jgi:hypothetical protein